MDINKDIMVASLMERIVNLHAYFSWYIMSRVSLDIKEDTLTDLEPVTVMDILTGKSSALTYE